MKKPKSKSFIFKAGVLVVAFALVVLCFPVNAFLAFAAENFGSTDLSYMTISSDTEVGAISKVVNRGATYTIPKAYIGGKILIDGKTGISGKDSVNTANEDLVSSSVTVRYGGAGKDILGDSAKTSFVAESVGTYVVTYSYTFKAEGDKQYTNTYELRVESVLSNAAFNFVDNTVVMPSKIDLSLKGAEVDADNDANAVENRDDQHNTEKTYRDVEIALPEIEDEDGEVVKDVKFVTEIPSDNTTEKFVLISVNGGTNTPSKDGALEKLKIYKSQDSEKFYIDGDDFKDARFGAGKYTIKYSYYIRNNSEGTLGSAQFVTSTTKEIQVYSKNDPHYVDGKYTLELQLASDWVDNGETGVEKALPKAKGVTSSTTNPANEEVEVSYKVEVQYRKDGRYVALDAEKYNASENDDEAEGGFKTIVEMDGDKSYLVDPTAFKPLDDGSYRFIYTITDFYGNTVTSSNGAYEYLNIIDEQDPTPIVYDASVERDEDEKLQDESYKLKTYAPSNAVVVYAIGVDDNVSTAGDSTMVREIRTSESVSKYTIADYNDKNLVFNYRKTNGADAYKNLLTNNYLIRKAVDSYNADAQNAQTKVENDASMLAYLAKNNYLIVVDKANYGHIYSIFADYIREKTGVSDVELQGEADANGNKKAENFLKWLEEKYSETKADGSKKTDEELSTDRKAISDLGFAYLDAEQTFGATSADGGMGATTYYIHYIVTDKQGNKADKSYEMNIGGEYSTDTERPEIKFATTLQDSYNPDLTVSFDAPTATDGSGDKNMKVRTFYRFLNGDSVVTLDKNGKELVEGGKYETLDDVFAELKEDGSATTDEKELAQKFKPYHTGGTKVGYIELTETNAGKYSIDLSKVSSTATKLQILAYAYDDAGNVGFYGETIKINNATDSYAPVYVESTNSYTQSVEQGETVAIPEVMVYDDNVAYMDYDLKVYFEGENGQVEIPTSGATSMRKNLGSGSGEYRVSGGKFIASFAGKYSVALTLSDSRNNSVTYFFNYEAKGRVVVKQPSISATLAKNQTIELDGDADYKPENGIEIPTPTVNYDISNSITYDQFTADGYVAKETEKYVIRGVDKNNKATNWSTEGQEGSFKPQTTGTKQIKYTVNLEVYNRTMFAYKEFTYKPDLKTYEGGYFVVLAEKDSAESAVTNRITPISENEIAIKDESKNEFLIVRENNPEWTSEGEAEKYLYKVYDYTNGVKGTEKQTSDYPDCMKNAKEATKWFGEIMAYTLESDIYTINVKDTIGPKLQPMDYSGEQYTIDEFKQLVNEESHVEADEPAGLKIYGIEASDASGIDFEKSQIVLSWRLANGVSSSHTYKGKEEVTKTNYFVPSEGNIIDGTYTVTYTVYDNNGNSSVSTYTVAVVGDTVQPTITVKEGLVQSSYQVGQGTKLRINPEKDLTFKDNLTAAEELSKTLKITLTNTAGDVTPNQELLDSEGVYEFTLDELGSYTITIEIEDSVGNKQTWTRTFDVVAQEAEATTVYQTVGTVLIVVSVLVLAGVIIYFIVSKVKLDKELKK